MDLLPPVSVSVSVSSAFFFLLFVARLLQNYSFTAAAAAHFSNETDRLALLRFKDHIIGDPFGALTSWNHARHFCGWQGVVCGRRHPQRVVALNLRSYNLVGRRISPYVSNLTFLRRIDLANNTFHGVIPAEIGRLDRLRYLYLNNNSLIGEIPANLTFCSELVRIVLYGNELCGNIPPELFQPLSKLAVLNLGHNHLTGRIPPSFGNMSSLTFLYLSKNRLEGSLPSELSKLSSLSELDVFDNQLSGVIPSSIYNLSSIEAIDLGINRLQGNLPPNLFLTLANLTWFSVGGNEFTGPVPVSLPNATGLQVVVFRENFFKGSVPVNLGSLQQLTNLQFAHNQLGSAANAHELTSFLDSITNCSNLRIFDMTSNSLRGALPASFANLSVQLQTLGLSRNKIFGTIPSGIGNLININSLGMGHNMLAGNIPASMGKLSKMGGLSLKGNRLYGEIPDSFCNMTRLFDLQLAENNLEGYIPPCLENCKQLQSVQLQNNSLVGTLPKRLSNLHSLINFHVQNNSLSGNLPTEVGHLLGLQRLDISNNHFTGEIPSSLGSCVGLEFLSLRDNHFHGFLPSTLNSLRGLRYLDVSRNNLSGPIPEYLEEFTLEYLNLSFNGFEGELPKQGIFTNASAISVVGNPKLCGGIRQLQLPACFQEQRKKTRMSHATKTKIIIAVVVLGSIAICFFFTYFAWHCKKSRKKLSCSNPSPSLEDPFMDVSYAELLEATDGFFSSNEIGMGNYGSVYKGILHQNNNNGALVVAVKVLNLLQEGALKSFTTECEALRNIRHRNLTKIFTCCSSIDFRGNDFKALVFEYMSNGSLQNWLSKNDKGNTVSGRNLKLIERLNIAIDVASALDYLHYHCQEPIIHCDLKPSNVLLDADMVAHVSDFGLARFASNIAQSSTFGMKGSIGYIAPEYAMGGKVSSEGDIYSYGILLLEMITGMGPTNAIFENNFTLHHHVRLALLADRVAGIADPSLFLEEADQALQFSGDSKRKMHACLNSIAEIGVACSAESPSERIKIKEVITKIHAIRKLYLGVRR